MTNNQVHTFLLAECYSIALSRCSMRYCNFLFSSRRAFKSLLPDSSLICGCSGFVSACLLEVSYFFGSFGYFVFASFWGFFSLVSSASALGYPFCCLLSRASCFFRALGSFYLSKISVTGPSLTISIFMYCPNAPGKTWPYFVVCIFSFACMALYSASSFVRNSWYKTLASSPPIAWWKSGLVPFIWW